jgi:hypothetical protein
MRQGSVEWIAPGEYLEHDGVRVAHQGDKLAVEMINGDHVMPREETLTSDVEDAPVMAYLNHRTRCGVAVMLAYGPEDRMAMRTVDLSEELPPPLEFDIASTELSLDATGQPRYEGELLDGTPFRMDLPKL